jgi:intracellular multiplication protein IcmG
MNDTYGSEPHEHDEHDENSSQGEGAVHEPPSNYEFADDEASIASEQTDAPSEAVAARRSPLLPIAAALGGIVLLGAVAWWQFGGSSSPAVPLPVPHAPALSMQPQPAPASKAPDGSPDSGPVAPKTASATPQDTNSAASTPPDISALLGKPTDANAPKVDAPAAVMATPVFSAPVASGPVVSAPAAASLAPASVLPAQTVLSPAVSAPQAAPAPVSGAADHRIETLTARVDSLQKALDQANQQLSQVSTVSTPPSAKALQDRIDKLEQTVAALEEHPSAAASGTDISSEFSAPSAPKAHKVSVIHTPKHKTVVHKQAQKAPEPIKPVGNWVLRAATPEQAWIAPNAASHDLKQVQVGDKLPGIGRITAIQQKGDNWVVQGTKGVIQ